VEGVIGARGQWSSSAGISAGSGGALLADEWQRAFPHAALPQEVLALGETELTRRGVVLRPGIDTPDPFRGRPNTVASKLGPGAELSGAQSTLADSRYIPEGPTPVDGLLQTERAGASASLRGRLGQTVDRTSERLFDLFSRLKESDSATTRLFDAAEDAKAFLTHLGMHGKVSGILTGLLENYVPRDILNPAVAAYIDAAASKFFVGRKFSDMTLSEVNDYVWQNGTKLTGNKPLRMMTKTPIAESVQGIMATVFNSKFIKGLRKLGDEGMAAAEFFGTNPALQMQRRLASSVRIAHKMHVTRELLGDDSPLVAAVSTFDEFEANATRMFDTDHVPVIERERGGVTEIPAADMLGPGLMMEDRAQVVVAKANYASYLHENLVTRTRSSIDLAEDLRRDLNFSLDTSVADLEQAGTPLARNILEQQEVGAAIKEDAAVRSLVKYVKGGGLLADGDLAKLNVSAQELVKLEEAVRDAKAAGLGRKSDSSYARRLIEQLKRPMAERREYMASLRKQEEMLRGTSKDWYSSLRERFKEVYDSAQAELKATGKTFDEFLTGATGESTLRDQLDAYVLSREAGVLAVDELQRLNPRTFEALRKANPKGTIKWVTRDAYKAIFAKGGAMDQLYHPQHAQSAMGMVGWMSRAWKAWTFMPPVFLTSRLRDMISSNVMYAQSGASPVGLAKAVPQAFKISAAIGDFAAKKGSKFLDEVMTNGTESFTVNQIIDRGFATGVYNWGFIRDEVTTTGAQIVAEELPTLADAPMKWFGRLFHLEPEKNTFIALGGELMEYLDNTTKTQAVISHWMGGKTLDEALELTKAAAYDPRNIMMSSFEKNRLRKVMPMWSWFRHAVSSQVDHYVKKPGTVTWFEKARQSAISAAGMSEEQFEAFMPDFVKDQFGIPVKVTKDGVSVKLFGGFFPMTVVGEMVSALEDTVSGDPARGLDWAGKQLHPLIRAPIEAAINRSFYSRRPLETAPGAKVEMFGLAMSPIQAQVLSNIRLLAEVDRLNVLNFGDFSRLFDGVARPQRTEIEQSFLEKLGQSSFLPISTVPGAKGYTLSAAEQLDSAANRTQAASNQIVSQIRRELERKKAGSPTADANLEALKRELARRVGGQQVVEELRTRFGAT